MHKILVTGGAGFIGSHVAEELCKRGYAVVILDDLSGGFEDNLPTGTRFVHGSITDADLINQLFEREKFVWVVPCVVDEKHIFLKTMFASRKYTKMLESKEGAT